MSESFENARISSRSPLTLRRQLGRLTPRRFDSQQSWHRFARDRRASLIERVGGEADIRQAHLIEQMVGTEWRALKLEAEADATENEKKSYGRLRLAADYRRQLLLLDRELAATTRKQTPAPERPPTLADYLEARSES